MCYSWEEQRHVFVLSGEIVQLIPVQSLIEAVRRLLRRALQRE